MTDQSAATTGARPLSTPLRWCMLIFSALPLLAGLSLFVGTTRTDDFSAWTIDSAITAATIGGFYWAGFFLHFLPGFERAWANVRVPFAVLFVFGYGNFVASLLDFDRFHTDSDSVGTLIVTYVWLVPYATAIIGPILLLWHQLRIPGGDPPRLAPIEGWAKILLGLQGLVLVGLGAAMFIAPLDVSKEVWPWELTPLTGRVIGTWMVATGVGCLGTIRENDWARVRAAAISFTLFLPLSLAAVLRYSDAVDFGGVRIWAYLLFLASACAVGAYGWRAATRARAASPEPALAGA